MSATSHRSELDLLRRKVADLTRELAERDRVLHERTRHLQVAQCWRTWEVGIGISQAARWNGRMNSTGSSAMSRDHER